MSLNEDLRGVLTCPHCENIYEQPIILPCQETICKKDLAKLYMRSSQEDIKFRTFKCPCCKVVHEEPLGGFPENKKIAKILDTVAQHGIANTTSTTTTTTTNTATTGSNKNFAAARMVCMKLSELYTEYTSLKENPYSYIEKYFERLRKQIEDNRVENKQILDRIYDGFLKDLKKLESECVSFTKANFDPDRESNNYETYSEFSNLPSQITEWQDELALNKTDEEKCESIGSNIRKMERELSSKYDQFKKSLLLNREVRYKQKTIDKNEAANYGQLKCNASDATNQTLTGRRESMQQTRIEIAFQQPRINENESSDTENENPQRLNPQQPQSILRRPSNEPRTNRNSNGGPVVATVNNLYIAVADYDAKSSEELSIEKGDVLVVNEEDRLNDSQWRANVFKRSNSSSGAPQLNRSLSGIINPSHVIRKANFENEPWYFGNIKRQQAEALLKRDANPTGAYMIRESESNSESSHCFSLSVRDQTGEIKHYRVHATVEGNNFSYYIILKVKFKSLNELIDYHSKKPEGLCTILTSPCKK